MNTLKKLPTGADKDDFIECKDSNGNVYYTYRDRPYSNKYITDKKDYQPKWVKGRRTNHHKKGLQLRNLPVESESKQGNTNTQNKVTTPVKSNTNQFKQGRRKKKGRGKNRNMNMQTNRNNNPNANTRQQFEQKVKADELKALKESRNEGLNEKDPRVKKLQLPPPLMLCIPKGNKDLQDIKRKCIKLTAEIITDPIIGYVRPDRGDEYRTLCQDMLIEMLTNWEDETWFHYQDTVNTPQYLKTFYEKHLP